MQRVRAGSIFAAQYHFLPALPMSHPAASTVPDTRVSLGRDLANLLVELAIAIQHHGVYPPGHPFLSRSADGLARRLDAVLRDRMALSFGVARAQLVIEGVATDAGNPVLAGLAARLHRGRIGAVTLRRGMDADEATEFLAALAAQTEPGRAAGEAARAEWPHAVLHPVSFAQLEFTGEGDGAAEGGARDTVAAAQLWIGLARAALAREDAPEEETREPSLVAQAIDQHPRAAAYDQVIVGYLLQMADELRAEGGRAADEVRRRVSEMIARLQPDTLARLVQMGGDAPQRRRFLLDASEGFAADAVVRLVQAAADAGGHSISHSLLRLLTKLSAHAEGRSGPLGAAADEALREQVERLVDGWALPDPNPETYTRALDLLSRSTTGELGLLPGPNAPEPERVVQTALEVGAHGPAVHQAVATMITGAALPRLVALLAEAPADSALAAELWPAVCQPAAVRALLRAGAEGAAALDGVAGRIGTGRTLVPILDELAESESRTVRRAALDRVARMGAAALPEIGARLGDGRWYVVRNLLGLVAEIGVLPPGTSLAAYLRHEDARVRREAFRAAFRVGGERERVLGLALTDADTQVQRQALAECASGCPAPVLPLVVRRIDDPLTEPEQRLLAIRVLGGARDPLALQMLRRLADGGRTLLGRVRLAPRSPELLAALSALRRGWSADPSAAALLRAALASTDPDVQRAARAEGDPP
ncbi:hypothetical protein [Longimicrobium sp.]|uniref:hypothetical protein n=1 Tax=Longimicrobium sp. TaxID=2029185 RepID=UPI002ED9DC8D